MPFGAMPHTFGSSSKGESHVELPGRERQCRGRQVLDDRIFNAVEIGPARFPIIRVSRYLDVLVGLEFDEFERASADRMASPDIPRILGRWGPRSARRAALQR